MEYVSMTFMSDATSHAVAISSSVPIPDGTTRRAALESSGGAHRAVRSLAIVAEAILSVNDGPSPTKVILNDPATVVLWDDGTKTVSKARGGDDGDLFSPTVGVAACVFKKVMGREARLDDFERLVRDAAWRYVTDGPTKLRSDAMAIRLAYATRNSDMTIHELAPTWVRVFATGWWDDDRWLSVADFILTCCAALELAPGHEALEREVER